VGETRALTFPQYGISLKIGSTLDEATKKVIDQTLVKESIKQLSSGEGC